METKQSLNTSSLLSDLRVIDASTVLAGPSVGMFLAELGADVIKIEHPVHGDVTRSWKLPSEKKDAKISNYFSSVNYGKRYQGLNLGSPTDREKFLKLIEKTDIVLTNFKKGDAEKFHLTDDVLRFSNPGLIHGKISGFGSDSDRVAYDLILQAETGFMSMNGQADGPPTKMPVALIDVLAAHHLKEGILLALYERHKTGKGRTVEVSLYDAAVSSLMNQASNYLMSQEIPKRIGSTHPNIAPYGELFETKDGAQVTFAIGSDRHFEYLLQTLEMGSLSENEKFINNQNRVRNRSELSALLQQKVQLWESSDLLDSLHSKGVPCGKIQNLEEVFLSKKAQSLILAESIDGFDTQRVRSSIFKWI